MVPVLSLWLPILVSAIAVFLASSLIHMVLKYHNRDVRGLPNEAAVADALRGTAPGGYALPYGGGMEAMKDPAFVERMKRGPVAHITVVEPRGPGFGKELLAWFIYSIVVSIFAAYIASRAVGAGGAYIDVFRFAGATAFIAYGVGQWQESIWWGRSWGRTLRNTLDALIYGLLTAGVFGWLWPNGG